MLHKILSTKSHLSLLNTFAMESYYYVHWPLRSLICLWFIPGAKIQIWNSINCHSKYNIYRVLSQSGIMPYQQYYFVVPLRGARVRNYHLKLQWPHNPLQLQIQYSNKNDHSITNQKINNIRGRVHNKNNTPPTLQWFSFHVMAVQKCSKRIKLIHMLDDVVTVHQCLV